MKGTVHVYRDRKGEWRWRAVSRNGRKVANCGEGYGHRQDALRFAASVAYALAYVVEIQRRAK